MKKRKKPDLNKNCGKQRKNFVFLCVYLKKNSDLTKKYERLLNS